MNRSHLIVAMVTFVLAIPVLDVIVFTGGQSIAVGQDADRGLNWEYKSVKFPANDLLEQTDILNKLAERGWALNDLLDNSS